MGFLRFLKNIFPIQQNTQFDIADIVRSIGEHPHINQGLVTILSLPEGHKLGALRTIIQRSEESGAPKRLITCLIMLKDTKLCQEVLIRLKNN